MIITNINADLKCLLVAGRLYHEFGIWLNMSAIFLVSGSWNPKDVQFFVEMSNVDSDHKDPVHQPFYRQKSIRVYTFYNDNEMFEFPLRLLLTSSSLFLSSMHSLKIKTINCELISSFPFKNVRFFLCFWK